MACTGWQRAKSGSLNEISNMPQCLVTIYLQPTNGVNATSFTEIITHMMTDLVVILRFIATGVESMANILSKKWRTSAVNIFAYSRLE